MVRTHLRTRFTQSALALAALGSVSACATDDGYGYGQRASSEGVGTVSGAVAGGAAGALLSRGNGGAVVVGAILGGLLGNRVGAGIDERDRRQMADAYYRGLDRPSGEPVEWREAGTGSYGRFAAREAYDRGGETCRSYDSEVFIRGRREVITGLACRDRDGRWRDVRDGDGRYGR